MRHGFGVGIAELCSRPGFLQSLYNAFGNKAEIFRLQLDRYGAVANGPIIEALVAEDDPLAALKSSSTIGAAHRCRAEGECLFTQTLASADGAGAW